MMGYYERKPTKRDAKVSRTIALAKSNPFSVKVGQVWRTWDVRQRSQADGTVARIKVIAFSANGAFAVCEVTQGLGALRPGQVRRQSIRLDRFKPNASGYKLLEDVA